MTPSGPPGEDRRRAARSFTVRTIPSEDLGFEALVRAVVKRIEPTRPEDLRSRLAALYPRVQVHPRPLADEPAPVWYVYREGHWVSPDHARWWEAPGVARIRYHPDMRIREVNGAAAKILRLPVDELVGRHYSEFVVPGAAEDADLLRELLPEVGELGGTLGLLTADHRLATFEHHTRVLPDGVEVVLRLVEEVAGEAAASATSAASAIRLEVHPNWDVAAARYARTVLDRMAEPTPAALEALVQRLYPRASVSANPDTTGGEGAVWSVWRDGAPGEDEPVPAGWWHDPALGRIVWDGETRVIAANDEAHEALRVGSGELVGRHLLDLVEPGRAEEARKLVALLADEGSATSTIRAVGGDGLVREYDVHVEPEGDSFVSVVRVRNEPA